MRKRKIIKIGGSLHVRLLSADCKDLDLKEGNYVDIEDIVKVE